MTVASPGVYSGKPRLAAVVQADRWLQAHPSVILCPLTSTLMEAPRVRSGLHQPSQLMVDKPFTGPLQGLIELELALRVWLELP